jgi:hypothetical protein
VHDVPVFDVEVLCDGWWVDYIGRNQGNDDIVKGRTGVMVGVEA